MWGGPENTDGSNPWSIQGDYQQAWQQMPGAARNAPPPHMNNMAYPRPWAQPGQPPSQAAWGYSQQPHQQWSQPGVPQQMGWPRQMGYENDKKIPPQVRMQYQQQQQQQQPSKQQMYQMMHQQQQQQQSWPVKMDAAPWESTSKDYPPQWHAPQHQAMGLVQNQQQWPTNSADWQTPPATAMRSDMHWQQQASSQQNHAAQQHSAAAPSFAIKTWQANDAEPRIDTFNPTAVPWTGPPQSPEAGATPSDLYWQDPNPKNKRQQRDTGTSLWGDPSSQKQEIRRWKEAEHEEFNKGPATSTWNQNTTGWGDSLPDGWRPSVWESSGGVVDENEARAVEEERNQGMQISEMSEHIQRAIAKGYLKPEILAKPLSADRTNQLNNLMWRVDRLDQAVSELDHLQINIHHDYSNGATVTAEYARLASEVEQLKIDINYLTTEIISGNPAVQRQGSSRLQQWQRRGQQSDNGFDKLTGALQSMGISEDKSSVPWATDSLDWSNPTAIVNDNMSHTGNSSPTLIGPQEFVPGKKWQWNDPNKLAEDPDATPASVKPVFGQPGWTPGAPGDGKKSDQADESEEQ